MRLIYNLKQLEQIENKSYYVRMNHLWDKLSKEQKYRFELQDIKSKQEHE